MPFDLTGTLSKLAGRDTADDTVDNTVDDTVDEGTGTMSQMARKQIMARINSLKAERSGGDNFSAFAAGLLRPTQTGSFGESLGYGLTELNKSEAASKEARSAREDLMLKYQLALADDEAKAAGKTSKEGTLVPNTVKEWTDNYGKHQQSYALYEGNVPVFYTQVIDDPVNKTGPGLPVRVSSPVPPVKGPLASAATTPPAAPIAQLPPEVVTPSKPSALPVLTTAPKPVEPTAAAPKAPEPTAAAPTKRQPQVRGTGAQLIKDNPEVVSFKNLDLDQIYDGNIVTGEVKASTQWEPITGDEALKYGARVVQRDRSTKEIKIDDKDKYPSPQELEKTVQGFANDVAISKQQIKTFGDLAKRSTPYTTGLAGAALNLVPGMPGYDLKTDLLAAKNKIALEEMARLKALSATGATGFGNQSDKELGLLQNSLANMDDKQSLSSLIANFKIVRQHYENAVRLLDGQARNNEILRRRLVKAQGGEPSAQSIAPSAASSGASTFNYVPGKGIVAQ